MTEMEGNLTIFGHILRDFWAYLRMFSAGPPPGRPPSGHTWDPLTGRYEKVVAKGNKRPREQEEEDAQGHGAGPQATASKELPPGGAPAVCSASSSVKLGV